MEKNKVGSPFMNIDFKIQNKYINKDVHSNWILFWTRNEICTHLKNKLLCTND